MVVRRRRSVRHEHSGAAYSQRVELRRRRAGRFIVPKSYRDGRKIRANEREVTSPYFCQNAGTDGGKRQYGRNPNSRRSRRGPRDGGCAARSADDADGARSCSRRINYWWPPKKRLRSRSARNRQRRANVGASGSSSHRNTGTGRQTPRRNGNNSRRNLQISND